MFQVLEPISHSLLGTMLHLCIQVHKQYADALVLVPLLLWLHAAHEGKHSRELCSSFYELEQTLEQLALLTTGTGARY